MPDDLAATPEEKPMATIFVLGPAFDSHVEPDPIAVPVSPTAPGRRQISFQSPPTSPGGQAHLQLLPPLNPGDVLPISLYAFFVPADSCPPLAIRTPDWFFKSGCASGSIHIGAADADGKLTVIANGVKPSLTPYVCQTVLEFQS